MFGQNKVNHKIAMRHYNALYCNRTYQEATQAYMMARGAGEGLQQYEYGNYLSDAALECCGHENYKGAVMVVLAIAGNMGADVYGAALRHLQNFATLNHIADLENGMGAK